MKSVILILITCAISCIVLGIDGHNYNNLMKQDLGYSVNNNRCIINPISVLNSLLKSNIEDRNYRLREILYKEYDYGTDTLIVRGKDAIYYSSTHPALIDSIVYYLYNTTNMTYTPDRRNLYYYDSQTEQLVRVEGSDHLNIPERQSRIIYDYDTQQRLTAMHVLVYYYEYGQLFEYLRYNYVYDTDNILSKYRRFINGFEPTFYRINYSHDTQCRISGYEYATSDDSLNWTNMSMTTFTYNPADVPTANTYIQYLSNVFPIRFSKEQFLDDNYGMLDEVQNQGWIDGEYQNTTKFIYSYDNLNRLESITMNNCYPNNILSPTNLFTYSYDLNNNLNQYSEQEWNTFINNWDSIQNQYEYAWEQYTPDDDETSPEIAFDISVYPNPFREAVNINLESKDNAPFEAAVYNVKGQLIKTFGKQKIKTFIWDGKDFNDKFVSSGIYLIKVNQNGHISSRKIIRNK